MITNNKKKSGLNFIVDLTFQIFTSKLAIDLILISFAKVN
jgi:hypothetical protein